MAGPFLAAGHSMGGRVALEIVRQAPDRVAGLGLLNTGVHPAAEGGAAKRQELVDLAYAKGNRALAGQWLPPMLSPNRVKDLRLVASLIEMVCRSTPEIFERQVGALLRRPDAREGLDRIACPAILASGTADGCSPLARHEEMARHRR
ncbi:alpha/beta fold hydrolase [Methylobacterium oryzisoli]|uniref:alpha/beta fold hydrolase n=1 Tax=Methylobacterium oryzisoli TaxID=3385502 RepID=UPI0038925756